MFDISSVSSYLENNSLQPPKEKGAATGMRAVACSGPFAAAIGSTIVTVPVSSVGAVAFGLTAVWTAINEYRSATQKGKDVRQKDETNIINHTGVGGWARELILSPGFAPTVQGYFYLYTAVEAFGTGKAFIGAVFALFAVGAAAAAGIGNLGYRPPPRKSLAIESYLSSVKNLLPDRVRTVLRDPGACFCTGNLALILYQLNLEKVLYNPLATTLFVGGLALATAGVVRGLFPLFSGKTPKVSGTASILGGVGDLALGTSSVFFGSAYTGFATLAWGVANILYGIKAGSTFVS
ncbi:MAG: hypothetical protein EBZ48_14560, partial [Proteobacteria bacterium]|nr:hypothetical protein [Pseudomonadota bacterium]